MLAIRLIDLDAAAKILKAKAGAKFSSGTLAPEMFAELSYSDVQRFEAYFESEKSLNSELWQKVGYLVVISCSRYEGWIGPTH